MDKDIINPSGEQNIKIIDRKVISITGVIKIDSFDNEEFLLETSLGHLVLKGDDLEMIKYDTHDGVINIKGMFNSMCYVDSIKDKKSSFFEKVFK